MYRTPQNTRIRIVKTQIEYALKEPKIINHPTRFKATHTLNYPELVNDDNHDLSNDIHEFDLQFNDTIEDKTMRVVERENTVYSVNPFNGRVQTTKYDPHPRQETAFFELEDDLEPRFVGVPLCPMLSTRRINIYEAKRKPQQYFEPRETYDYVDMVRFEEDVEVYCEIVGCTNEDDKIHNYDSTIQHDDSTKYICMRRNIYILIGECVDDCESNDDIPLNINPAEYIVADRRSLLIVGTCATKLTDAVFLLELPEYPGNMVAKWTKLLVADNTNDAFKLSTDRNTRKLMIILMRREQGGEYRCEWVMCGVLVKGTSSALLAKDLKRKSVPLPHIIQDGILESQKQRTEETSNDELSPNKKEE